MRVRTIGLILAALIPVAAGAANPPPAYPTMPLSIMSITDDVIDAANSGNAAELAKLYTGDAVVVDEIPPFVWRGSGAGVAWWHAVDAFMKKAQHRIRLTAAHISEFQRSGTDAYLIQAMTLEQIPAGKHSEPGTLTYTFHKSGGSWLISSQVWTTKP